MTPFSSTANPATDSDAPGSESTKTVPEHGRFADGFEDEDEPSPSLREQVQAGITGGIALVRNTPAFARTVWQSHRPWLWLVLAFFLMAFPTLRRAWTLWTAPESLVFFQLFLPLATFFLIWNRREEIIKQYQEILFLYGKNSPKLHGNLWPIALGCVGLLLSTLTLVTPLGLFSLALICFGVAYYLYGPFVLRPLLTPLLFLFLITPLPIGLTSMATGRLLVGSQIVSGQLLSFLIKDTTQRLGYVALPNFTLTVSQASSGSELIFPLLCFVLWISIFRRVPFVSGIVLLIVTGALIALLSIIRLVFIGFVGNLLPALGGVMQDPGALFVSSLLLGFLGAYLVYKIAVLLTPPRLI